MKIDREEWDRLVTGCRRDAENGVTGDCGDRVDRLVCWAASELERLREDREALLSFLIQEGPETPPLWHSLQPDSFSPFGMSWHEHETREEAVSAALEAARVNLAEVRAKEAKRQQ